MSEAASKAAVARSARRGGEARSLAAVAVSVLVHALAVLLLGAVSQRLAAEKAQPWVDAALEQTASGTGHRRSVKESASSPQARAEQRRALKTDVQAGRLPLGEAFIALEQDTGVDRDRAERARRAYQTVLGAVRRRMATRGQPLPRAILAVLRDQGLSLHRQLHHTLTDAVLGGGGDCVARTRLIVALVYDLGFSGQAYARVFSNHLAPSVGSERQEYRFGMVADCSGPGVRVAAVDLLDEQLPAATDACRDDEALLSDPLRDDDPAPSWSGREPRVRKHCPLALWPWREAGDPVYLSGRQGAIPHWGAEPVWQLEPTPASLLAYAAGLACHKRWLRQLREQTAPGPVRLPFLAKALGYQQEAALVFAAAGELELTRAVEQEQAETLAEARRWLSATNWNKLEVLHEFWSLVFLGPEAHALLLELAERDNSWFSSNLVAVLIREPTSRAHALKLMGTRGHPQQIEIADRVYWDDPEFVAQLARVPEGRLVLRLRAALDATRRAWKSCSLPELSRIAHQQVGLHALDHAYGAALVAVLAEEPILHLDQYRCDADEFARALRRWRVTAPPQLGAWLDRARKAAAGSRH